MSTPVPDQLVMKNKRRKHLLKVIYDVLDVDKENKAYSLTVLADLSGLTRSMVGDYLSEFDQLGIISRRYEYGGKDTGMPSGRHYHLTFLVSEREAQQILAADDEERSVQAIQALERLRASHTTEPRKPKQKPKLRVVEPVAETGVGPGAIVDLARKYRDSTGIISAKLRELQALADEIGTPLDMALMREALGVNAALDPRLEAICEVLPYIEALERKVEAMTEMLDAATAKVAQG